MLRTVLCSVVALLLFVGGAFAAEGTVVSFDKAKGTATVKVGDKEHKIDLKSVKVLNPAGKEIAADKVNLKAGAKIEVTESGGKVTELKMPKPNK